MTSNPERAFAYWLQVLAPDIPYPQEEYRFDASRRWRFDFAWPEKLLAVECNGGKWRTGGGRHNTAADYEKMQAACALGWRVFPVLPEQLNNDPAGLIDRLREAYNL